MDCGLIILDGWGYGEHTARDAIKTAETPTFDAAMHRGASGQLTASGRAVGLPKGQMGNSEVGHLNIGAGRVIKQIYTRIEDAIAAGEFVNNKALSDAFERAARTDVNMHFLGLVSDGGVHAEQNHLHALIDLAAEHGLTAVTHAFMDGRDTDPHGGERYLRRLQDHIGKQGTGEVGTIVGRYYAMDRDENWERTHLAYDAIVNHNAPHTAKSAVTAVKQSYDRGDSDEFVEPTLISDRPPIRTDDVVICFNFRPDRVRQLIRMLIDHNPTWEPETTPPKIHLTTMSEYDESFSLPVAFRLETPENTLGKTLATAEKTQFRIAESEKYPHVTYFLNGGREIQFAGEHREIIQSPDVPTYDSAPEMSAALLTDTAIEHIQTSDPDTMILNYANPDMVGHTGDFSAVVAAVETVDRQLHRVLKACFAAESHVLITADHGNADNMGTTETPHTAHTTNPVPFVYLSPQDDDGDRAVRPNGSLCDIAPTILRLITLAPPSEMTGRSLLVQTESTG